MKKIAVVTSTRAEYGLLMPVINALRKYENEQLKIELIVTGTHLSKEYGFTINEIVQSKTRIDKEILITVYSRDSLDISHNQSVALEKFTRLFVDEQYNGVVILGDRYEMLSIAIAAGNTHTPIFHLCGGDTTEGALDEWIRHSITKMSYLHFVTNFESYKRVVQLGEEPSRVFNYGSTSLDNVLHYAAMDKQEALSSLGLNECKYVMCTYHPVTMEDGTINEQINSLVDTIKMFPEMEFIVTKANADQGGTYINELLDKAAEQVINMHVYFSLGVVRYLSLMKHAEFVLGNSSSGIIETPSFGIPTINIGDRQRGRLQAASIINCKCNSEDIKISIEKALDLDFREKCSKVISPYGDGNAAVKIAKKIVETVCYGTIDLKKKFYDNK